MLFKINSEKTSAVLNSMKAPLPIIQKLQKYGSIYFILLFTLVKATNAFAPEGTVPQPNPAVPLW